MSKVKSILKTIAPALGAAVGGPWGVMAGKFISQALGKDEPKNENDLLKMVEGAIADPELALKLKQANDNFQIRMEELGVDVFRIEVDDRKNARGEFSKVYFGPQIVISIAYNIIYFLILREFIGMLTSPDDINQNVMMVISGLVGLLTGELPRINSFWFGSSMGSKEKTQGFLHKERTP